jgi:rhodanese-related sulfurtransferase
VSPRVEAVAWAALIAILAVLVAGEGIARAALERRLPVEAKELYRALARSQTGVQVVDVRPELEDAYEDAHVPGSIPMPACDRAQAPAGASDRIHRSVPTVLVAAPDADPQALRACLAQFTAARVLAGGMDAWADARLPEDVGEYTPPSAKAGGGCL